MARIVGTTGSARPAPKLRVKPKAPKPKPFVLKGPHDIGTTAQPPRRGHAPASFARPLSTPTQRIQATQNRHTARAVAKVQGHPLPARPLTQREVNRTLGLGPNATARIPRSIAVLNTLTPQQLKRVDFDNLGKIHGTTPVESAAHAQAQAITRGAKAALPKPKKATGGGSFPAAVISDIGAELKGSGAVEKGITKLGAMSAAGYEKEIGGKTGRFLGNVVSDTASIGAGAIPSIAIPIEETATGHAGKAAKQLAAPFVALVKHPGKQLYEHPVSSFLIVRGAEGAASRLAGTTARSGLAGEAAARVAATTERTPVALGGSALHVRNYSKGLAENLVQRKLDARALGKRKVVLNVPARDEHGRLVENRYVTAVKATPLQHSRLGGARLDREYGSRIEITRQRRDQALHAFDRTKPQAHDAVGLVNEGVLKTGNHHRPMTPATVRQDLEQHLAQLKDAGQHLEHPARVKANAENIAKVEGLLNNARFMADPADAIASARHYAGAMRETEGPRARYGDFTMAQARRRILIPFAQREHNVSFNHESGRFERMVQVPVHVAQKVDRATAQIKDALERARTYATPTRIDALEGQLANATHRAAADALKTARSNAHDTETIGLPISDKEIIDAFRRSGGNLEDLAYVPAKDVTGKGSFFGSHFRRGGAETKHFTGAATLSGAYTRDFEQLRAALAKGHSRIGRHEAMNHLIHVYGHKQANGQYFTPKAAESEIQALAAKGESWVAVNAARKSAPGSLLEGIHPGEQLTTFREVEPGDSHIVLFPEYVAKRIASHQNVKPFGNPAFAGFTRATRAFRHTVLPLSPRFIPNYALEAAGRMLWNSTMNPVDVAATIRAGHVLQQRVKNLGPEGEAAVEQLKAESGKMLYGSQHQMDIYNPDEGAIMRFLHGVRQSGAGKGKATGRIGPKGVFDAWDGYVRLIHNVASHMEESAYFYAIGKQGRADARALMASWHDALNAAGPAYEDVARGLLQSDNIDRYARLAEEVRGKYSNTSPSVRWLTGMFTPFLSWYLAAAKFLALMPVRHPVKTAALAAAVQGTQQARAAYGLPSYAQSSLPLGGGRYIDIEHYTPFGLFEGDGIGPNLAGLVLPQAQDIVKNLEGVDSFNRQLPKGIHPGAVALETAAETFIPLITKIRQIREQGGTSEPNSNILFPHVRAGTKKNALAGLSHAFNPGRTKGGSRGSSADPLLQSTSSGGNPLLDSGSSSRSNPLIP